VAGYRQIAIDGGAAPSCWAWTARTALVAEFTEALYVLKTILATKADGTVDFGAIIFRVTLFIVNFKPLKTVLWLLSSKVMLS
jgi:hypothetical protein